MSFINITLIQEKIISEKFDRSKLNDNNNNRNQYRLESTFHDYVALQDW